MLHQNLCLTCGAELKKVDDTHYACESCGNVYAAEKVENYVDKMRELLDDAKLEMIATARKNLYSAITEEHLSSEKICKWSDEIKKYLPDDFQANFYGAFDERKDLQEIAAMIRNIDIEENFECLDLLLNFLIKSLESELVTDTLYLIECAYKLFSNNLEKYNKYSTLVSIEAQKLDDCIYETNYPRDVFVAYSSKDSKKALELVSELEAQGLSCFIALRNLRHGSGSKENYEKALREAMDSCTSFVFVSSMNSRNQACDALKVEIPYIKRRDEHRAASVPFTTYANIPIEYKKPRVEYRLEESTRRLAADRIVDEFFVGYERVYTPIDVAERVMRQSEMVVSDSSSQVTSQVDIAKLVEEQIKSQREAEQRKVEEQERLRREEEERKRQEIENRKREEEARKRKEEEERKRKEEEERKRKDEEKEKCDLLLKEYFSALDNEKEYENQRVTINQNVKKLTEKLENLRKIKENWDSVELKISQLNEKAQNYDDKISQLNNELNGLGFFAMKRKNEILDIISDSKAQRNLILSEIDFVEKSKQKFKTFADICNAIEYTESKINDEKDKLGKLTNQCYSEKIYNELIQYEYGKTLITSVSGHIEFGLYPQTKVVERDLIKALNEKAGNLPDLKNSYEWISYDYYLNGNLSNFMWYIDLEYSGEKYRGVYFISYRACVTTEKNLSGTSYQLKNGYNTNTVYWFKYEPISWTVLSKNQDAQSIFVCCDMIIDSQQFDVAKNNYAESTVRKWLNETFYNTAFNELQRESILTTTVDNSALTTGNISNKFACQNTQDKLFLLSYADVTNIEYGFSSNIARQKKTTNYAQIQGAYSYVGGGYSGNGYWQLRSPNNQNLHTARGVRTYGYVQGYDFVYNTNSGIVPAMWIKL